MPSRLAVHAVRRALSTGPVTLPLRTASLPRGTTALRLCRGPSPRSRAAFSTSPSRCAFPMAAEAQVTPESLSATLQQKIGATHVQIEDMSGGCGQAFTALIVSPEFEKKTLLARHRLVNNALKEEIAAIHAWTPRCLTPEQWEKEQAKMQS